MTTIGQNSPATPLPRTAVPSGVSSSPASDRIGTSVPSAVVASATPRIHPSASTPDSSRIVPAARPIASDIAQPAVPSPSARRGTRFSTTSSPAKKNRNTSPMVGEELDVRVGVREAERLGADEDPQDDLDHDGRQEQR